MALLLQDQWHQAEQVLQGGLARANAAAQSNHNLLCALVELHALRLQWREARDALAQHKPPTSEAQPGSPALRTLDCLANMAALATVRASTSYC